MKSHLARNDRTSLRGVSNGRRARRPNRPLRKARFGWGGHGLESLEGRLLLAGPDQLMMIELQRDLNLVPENSFQAVSIANGKWDDATTWQGGHVPTDGDNVLISDGTTVTITSDEAVKNVNGTAVRNAVKMMRVDGTLAFDTSPAPAGSTTPVLRRLLVDTIVVSPMNQTMPDGTMMFQNDDSMMGGVFQMGTSQNPIPYGVKAVVVFADNGPVGASGLDPNAPQHGTSDPYELGRGLIVAGSTATMDGTEVTSFATVAP